MTAAPCVSPYRRWTFALVLLAFVAALSAVSLRTFRNVEVPGHPELPRYGLLDFRDAVYYPARALLDGGNPYRPSTYRARYPVGSRFPLYTPLVLAIHLPFGLLSERAAGIAHYAFSVLCILLLAHLGLRLCALESALTPTLALGTALLLGRPGQTTLFTGECTAYVCIGVYLALGWADSRPWIGAVGVALALLKATFGVPLVLLMLARRSQRRAAVNGILIAAVGSAAVAAVLMHAEGGIVPWLDSLRENYLTPGSPSETYIGASVLALDAAAFFDRLLGHAPGAALAGIEAAVSVTVLALGLAALARATRASSPDRRLVAVTIACLTVLLSVHHQAYDALLLALPATAIASGRCSPALAPRTRWLLLALVLVPWVNYAATFAFLDRWPQNGWTWLVITSANGGALLAAFAVATSVVFKPRALAPGAGHAHDRRALRRG
jgi:hypothetical protein